MSVFEKIDMFSASLPKMCVYCAYGYPVVFGRDDWLEVFACGAHLVENLRSKRTTLDKHAYSGMFDGPAKNVYMPWSARATRATASGRYALTGEAAAS